MSYLADRMIFTAIGLGLAAVLAPWKLDWWFFDIVLGIAIFVVGHFRDPSATSTGFAWFSIGLAVVIAGIAYWLATDYGLSISELQSNRSAPKLVRRLPDLAIVFLVGGCLSALVVRIRKGPGGDSNGRTSDA